jgi:hypothetical protein
MSELDSRVQHSGRGLVWAEIDVPPTPPDPNRPPPIPKTPPAPTTPTDEPPSEPVEDPPAESEPKQPYTVHRGLRVDRDCGRLALTGIAALQPDLQADRRVSQRITDAERSGTR